MSRIPEIAVVGVLLGVAVAFDVGRRRIPNAITVAVAAAALCAQTIHGGAMGALSGVVSALLVAVFLWPAWAGHVVGGGDLKLAVGGALWAGLSRLTTFALWTAIAAGGLGIVCYVASSSAARKRMRANLGHAVHGATVSAPIGPEEGRVSVPAGVAVAIGTLVAVSVGG